MLNISKVTYGLQPCGPGNGNRALGIYVYEDGEDLEEVDNLYSRMTTIGISKEDQEKYEKYGQDLYDKLLSVIKESGLDKEWEAAILKDIHMNYIFFIGNEITEDRYFYITNEFMYAISRDSANLQKVFKDKGDGSMIELEAPHFALSTDPLNGQLVRDIYQVSKFCVGRLKVRKVIDGKEEVLNKENFKKFFHENSVANINRHTFGSFIFRPESEEDLKIYDDTYAKWISFRHISAVFISPKSDDHEFKNKVAKWALDHRYRYNEYLTVDSIIDFYND